MTIDRLLTSYENGRLARRKLLAALSTLAAASAAEAQTTSPPLPVKTLNHVTMFASNVQRSMDFYQKWFGMPVLTRQDPGFNLSTAPGSGFVGIYPAQGNTPPAINHLCLGIEQFDADRTLKQLNDAGVKARTRMRGDVKELYLTDPDGISVQLQDVSYKG